MWTDCPSLLRKNIFKELNLFRKLTEISISTFWWHLDTIREISTNIFSLKKTKKTMFVVVGVYIEIFPIHNKNESKSESESQLSKINKTIGKAVLEHFAPKKPPSTYNFKFRFFQIKTWVPLIVDTWLTAWKTTCENDKITSSGFFFFVMLCCYVSQNNHCQLSRCLYRSVAWH